MTFALSMLDVVLSHPTLLVFFKFLMISNAVKLLFILSLNVIGIQLK